MEGAVVCERRPCAFQRTLTDWITAENDQENTPKDTTRAWVWALIDANNDLSDLIFGMWNRFYIEAAVNEAVNKNNLVVNVQNSPLQVKINGNKQSCVLLLSVWGQLIWLMIYCKKCISFQSRIFYLTKKKQTKIADSRISIISASWCLAKESNSSNSIKV